MARSRSSLPGPSGPGAANDLEPRHEPQGHAKGDDGRLDEVLNRGRRAHTERHLLQLRQEERAHRRCGDAAAAAEQGRAAEHDRRDRRQEVGAADKQARHAEISREQNTPAAA